jgi:uncharacterized protein YrzB (UPF0473 family)
MAKDFEKDHEHEEEMDFDEDQPTVTLTLEDNSELECHVLGTFDVDNKEYIAVLPLESDEALIYKYVEKDGDVELLSIESDEEFESVSEAFYSFFDEDEDDEDDENEE